MDALNRWREVQQELEELPKLGPFHPLQTEWQATAEAEYRRLHPRKKKMPKLSDMIKTEPTIKDLYDQFNDRAKSLIEDTATRKSRLVNELLSLAKEIDLQPGDEFRVEGEYHGSTYRTVGGGCSRYAKCQAEMAAHRMRLVGLEAEVKPSIGRDSFICWVKASPEMIEIARRKPTMSMRDVVIFQWKQGANPRVFNPFLPHGFEEQNGIDYFGNDLRKQGA